MAIVATIHQPSEEILSLFHKAIILSSTGAIVFHDTPNVSKLETFLVKTIPSGYRQNFNCFRNPADVMIGIASSIKRSIAKTTKDASVGQYGLFCFV